MINKKLFKKKKLQCISRWLIWWLNEELIDDMVVIDKSVYNWLTLIEWGLYLKDHHHSPSLGLIFYNLCNIYFLLLNYIVHLLLLSAYRIHCFQTLLLKNLSQCLTIVYFLICFLNYQTNWSDAFKTLIFTHVTNFYCSFLNW